MMNLDPRLGGAERIMNGIVGAALVAFALLALPTAYGLLAAPGVRFPQAEWTAWTEVAYHAQKVVPVLALFLWIAGSEILRAVRDRDLWITERLVRRGAGP